MNARIRGFLLIEVLVTLGVLLLILATLGSAVWTFERALQRQIRHELEITELDRLRSDLRDDLRGAAGLALAAPVRPGDPTPGWSAAFMDGTQLEYRRIHEGLRREETRGGKRISIRTYRVQTSSVVLLTAHAPSGPKDFWVYTKSEPPLADRSAEFRAMRIEVRHSSGNIQTVLIAAAARLDKDD